MNVLVHTRGGREMRLIMTVVPVDVCEMFSKVMDP